MRSAKLLILLTGLFWSIHVEAASLHLNPETSKLNNNAEFVVSVVVDTEGDTMNAVGGTIDFPNNLLKVVSVSKQNSVINIWVQEPSFSNTEGKVRFEGIILNPGYSGRSSKILNITFQTKAPGSAILRFLAGSVLANDGEGTNILRSMSSASYTILNSGNVISSKPIAPSTKGGPIIRSQTHPIEENWYNLTNLNLDWDISSGVDALKYSLNSLATFNPTEVSGGAIFSNISYDISKFTDGIWYFHLSLRKSNAWSGVGRRMIKVDLSPPSPPVLSRETADLTDPNPVYSWNAIDSASGIAKYSLKIGDGDWQDISPAESSHFRMPLQAPGDHQITVRATDRAGNSVDGGTIIIVNPIESPIITNYSNNVRSIPDAFWIEGAALPKADIYVYLKSDSRTIFLEGNSDNEGRWKITSQKPIPSGSWSVSAKTRDNRGALSLESKSYPLKVLTTAQFLINLLIKSFFSIWALVLLILTIITILYFIIARNFRLINKARLALSNLYNKFIEIFAMLKNKPSKEAYSSNASKILSSKPNSNITVEKFTQDIKRELEALEKTKN